MPPSLTGRENLLRAVNHHPYARLTAGGDVHGYHRDGALVWTARGPWGPVAASFGDAKTAAKIFGDLAAAGGLDGVRWLHLPRVSTEQLNGTLDIAGHDNWDFLWTTTVPGTQRGEQDVQRLAEADHEGIRAVLDDALPEGTSRPGDPDIRRWYGIRVAGRCVAVAADRSVNGVGFLAGIAVLRDCQGRGYGSALTAALTRRLVAEHGICALGVMADSERNIGFYQRLGYRHRITRSSVMLAAV